MHIQYTPRKIILHLLLHIVNENNFKKLLTICNEIVYNINCSKC
jgi:hypothetical protein